MGSVDSLERHTFDDDGRIYTNYDDLWLPSVSTVLDVREKPPGLKKYLRTTSESEKKQRTFYTQNRGTLIHYAMLSQLVEEEFWSDDEQNSEDCLRGKRTHNETGLTGDYETWQRYKRDEEWALDAWSLVRDVYGIHPETTIGVELFVRNTDIGYAGQFDLLYADGSDVVLADVKTSKRVYKKHLIQLVAYKHAVDIAVDRMEVIRINPDGKRWEVSSSEDWIEDEDELWSEFIAARDRLEQEKIEQLKHRVESDE